MSELMFLFIGIGLAYLWILFWIIELRNLGWIKW